MSAEANQLLALVGKSVEVHVGDGPKVICYVFGALRLSKGRWYVLPAFGGANVGFSPEAVRRVTPGSEAEQAAGLMARIYV